MLRQFVCQFLTPGGKAKFSFSLYQNQKHSLALSSMNHPVANTAFKIQFGMKVDMSGETRNCLRRINHPNTRHINKLSTKQNQEALVVQWLTFWFSEQGVWVRARVAPLRFQRFGISCVQVAMRLKYCKSDVKHQNNPTQSTKWQIKLKSLNINKSYHSCQLLVRSTFTLL